MSDLPAGALDYPAVVAEFFLGLRGGGLMLSPLDQEVVLDWERRGLPVAVVCRGLRRGLEEQGERGPRSLRALRLAVEDEWRGYRAARVGDAPAPPAEADAAAARLARARELVLEAGRAAEAAHREGYRAAWRALAEADAGGRPGSPLDRVEAAIALADVLVLRAWLAALPAPERRALGPRIRLVAGPRSRRASRRAYRDGLRAHLVDLARAAGLTCLRGSV